jgi:hypothetical protein
MNKSNFDLFVKLRETWCSICATIDTAELILDVHPRRFRARVDDSLPGASTYPLADRDLLQERDYEDSKGGEYTLHIRVTKSAEPETILVIIDTPNFDAEIIPCGSDDGSSAKIRGIIVNELRWISQKKRD